jgi:hypothetical protein
MRKWNGKKMRLSRWVAGADHQDLRVVGTGDPGAKAMEMPEPIAALSRGKRGLCQMLAAGGQVTDADGGEDAAIGQVGQPLGKFFGSALSDSFYGGDSLCQDEGGFQGMSSQPAISVQDLFLRPAESPLLF